MTALSHAHRFPNARATTLARLIVQERKTEQLMAEVDAHVAALLVSELSEKLPGLCRADRERIRESF